MSSEPNSEQLSKLQLTAKIERERKRESAYFRLFSDLLKEKRDVILRKTVADEAQMKDYAKEMEILKKVVSVERDALVGGFVVGTVALLSVRLLPRMAIRLIGGEAKVNALRESEIAGRGKHNAFLKRRGTFLFESSFAFWAAWRGYNVAGLMKANNLADDITKLPLVEGRSILGEEICPDLTALVNKTIPSEFWRNMNVEGALQNHDNWEQILKFSANCEKRRRYEEMIRKQQGLKVDEVVAIPKPGVPEISSL